MTNFCQLKFLKRERIMMTAVQKAVGDSREPSWVLHGDALSEHISQLHSDIQEMKGALTKREEKEHVLPMVMSTTVHNEALAKSHRGRITSVLDSDGADNVIGMDGNDRILSLVSDMAVLDSMEGLLCVEENAAVISSISGMEEYQPYVEPFDQEHNSYRVRLIDYNDFDRNNMVRTMFEQY